MQSVFSPDSKVMQALSRVFDLMVLNCLFLLCCLPVVTVGPASAAMYTVCFRLGTDREEGVVRPFFRAFRENLRQGVIAWLLFLLFFAMGLLDLLLLSQHSGGLSLLRIPVLVLLFLGVLVYGYVFPLLSQFENKLLPTFKNAMLLSIAYLPRSIAIGILNLLPPALLVLNTYLFLQISVLWLFLYYAASAYLIARMLKPVFTPLMTGTEPQEGEAV